MQVLLDAIPAPVFYKDAQGMYLGCNRAFEEYFGMAREELVGKSVFDIAPAHLADEYHRQDRALLENPSSKQVYESSVTTADAKLRHVVFHKAAFYLPDGSLGGLIGAILDISSRKATQEQLQARLAGEAALAACTRALVGGGNPDAALQEGLRHLLDTAQASRAYIFQNSYDPQRGLCMSQTHEAVAAGIQPEIDNPDLQQLPYQEGFSRWRELLSAGREVAGLVEGFPAAERQVLRAQGIESILVLPMNAAGKWIGFIGFDALHPRDWSSEDIRLLRSAAETLGNYIARLQEEQRRKDVEEQFRQSQKMESLGILAGGLAHDFNNLLMVITGNVDLAMMDSQTGESTRECLQEIKKAAQQAAKLSNQMRAFSGQGHAAVQPLQLNRIITDMTELLRSSVSRRIEVLYELAEDLPILQADPTQMNQVVMNLFINASEAVGQGQGTITVRTATVYPDAETRRQATPAGAEAELAEGPYVELAILDTGCGMDAETLPRVFEPFFSTKFIGRGLGLAAVQGIVRGHKGGILVESRPGEGTAVRVLLPAAPAPGPKPAPEPETLEPAEQETRSLVLLADDEKAVLTVAKAMLKRAGYDVLTATNGQQAVDLAREHAADLQAALLDMTMPVKNGLDTLGELRKTLPAIPVFLCSGHDEEHIRVQLNNFHNVEFLQKPFQMNTLLEKLQRALRRETP